MDYILGIDASRCRSGGAYSHIVGIICNLKPSEYNFEKVHIWSHSELLDRLPNEDWLIKHSPKYLNKSLFFQMFWQFFLFNYSLKTNKCNILLTLDASSLCKFSPQVVLSRDLLSYEPGIMKKYGWSKDRLRILLIKWLQNSSFRNAAGVVFLTEYTSRVIQRSCGKLSNFKIIPHGVSDNFKNINIKKKWPSSIDEVTCLYISNAELYKNQWHVVKAIELLRSEGFNLQLVLVGGGNGLAQELLSKQIELSDPNKDFIKQYLFVSQNEILEYLKSADVFIFASSCEAFGITLLEAMAAGLPIACSNRSGLPELLNGSGVLFDPENPISIFDAVKKIVKNEYLRKQLKNNSKLSASVYSWDRCSRETFSYLKEVLEFYKSNH
jgi:glycosyltransferase involved in cell wall biosynthesis